MVRLHASLEEYKLKAYLVFLDCPREACLQARPGAFDFTLYSMIIATAVTGPFVHLNFFSWVILIFIAVTSFWSLTLVGKVAIIFVFSIRHIKFFFRRVPYRHLMCIVSAVVYACAKKSIGDFSILDHIFVDLSIIGNIGAVIGMFLYKNLIAPGLYDEWRLVFGPKWPNEARLVWSNAGEIVIFVAKMVIFFVLDLPKRISTINGAGLEGGRLPNV